MSSCAEVAKAICSVKLAFLVGNGKCIYPEMENSSATRTPC